MVTEGAVSWRFIPFSWVLHMCTGGVFVFKLPFVFLLLIFLLQGFSAKNLEGQRKLSFSPLHLHSSTGGADGPGGPSFRFLRARGLPPTFYFHFPSNQPQSVLLVPSALVFSWRLIISYIGHLIFEGLLLFFFSPQMIPPPLSLVAWNNKLSFFSFFCRLPRWFFWVLWGWLRCWECWNVQNVLPLVAELVARSSLSPWWAFPDTAAVFSFHKS